MCDEYLAIKNSYLYVLNILLKLMPVRTYLRISGLWNDERLAQKRYHFLSKSIQIDTHAF